MSKILAIFVIAAAIGVGVAQAADSTVAHHSGERWRCSDNPGGACS